MVCFIIFSPVDKQAGGYIGRGRFIAPKYNIGSEFQKTSKQDDSPGKIIKVV